LGCVAFDWDLLKWRDVAMSNNNDRGSPIGLIVSIHQFDASDHLKKRGILQ